MFSIILSACVLAYLTVAIHATGIALLLRTFMRLRALPTSILRIAVMLLRMVWWLVLLHMTEIFVWALFYLWRGLVTDTETAFYFSGVTYTTIGYGDVLLPKPWRLLGPIEGLMGILMCSLSTGYFFLIGSRIYQSLPKKAAGASSSE